LGVTDLDADSVNQIRNPHLKKSPITCTKIANELATIVLVSPNPNQIQLSTSNRGITDYFFCFTRDEHVWDCDHLLDERLLLPRVAALEGSKLQSFTYDGASRVLEIEFRVTVPFAYNAIPLPPLPHVIQYCDVPRYVFTKLTRCTAARRQERYWEDIVRRRFKCQTVRTVCRLPRVWRFSEARNVRRYTFEDYLLRLASNEQLVFELAVTTAKILLLRVLAPKHVAGLGGRWSARVVAVWAQPPGNGSSELSLAWARAKQGLVDPKNRSGRIAARS